MSEEPDQRRRWVKVVGMACTIALAVAASVNAAANLINALNG